MIASQKIGKSFMGALNYNLKKLNHPDPKMRAELLESNFNHLDPILIKKEVDLVRSLRPGLNRYVYHTSLNFAKEDNPDNQKLLAIAHDYLQASGYQNNQYMIFRHHDTAHPHVHLLVNRIGFDGKVVSDSNNFKKSEALLRKLEAQYSLTAVEPSYKSEIKAVKKGELEMVIRTGKPSDKMILQELMKGLLNEKQALTVADLIKKGEKAGVNFLFNQASTGRVTGITYFYGNFKAKGQALGNQFKWAEIIKKANYEQTRDSQAISQANSRTTTRYGNGAASGENRTSAEGYASGNIRPSRSDVPNPYGNKEENRTAAQSDTRNLIATQQWANAAEQWSFKTDGQAGKDSRAYAEGTIQANHDADLLDTVSHGNQFGYAIGANLFPQISDDEDDEKRRRKKRNR